MIQLALHLTIDKLNEINNITKLSEDELIALMLGSADLLHNLPSKLLIQELLKMFSDVSMNHFFLK